LRDFVPLFFEYYSDKTDKIDKTLLAISKIPFLRLGQYSDKIPFCPTKPPLLRKKALYARVERGEKSFVGNVQGDSESQNMPRKCP
jgi:hypothetical protein